LRSRNTPAPAALRQRTFFGHFRYLLSFLNYSFQLIFCPFSIIFRLTVLPRSTRAAHAVPITELSYDGVIPRKRNDGSTGYRAQLLIKRAGKIVHRKGRTFDRKPAATAWLEKREKELAKPGALERLAAPDPTLASRRYRPLYG
jgi:hypothetical protein